MLDFLVQNGQASVLAEPRLSCRSGGSAKFIAGGELPIPMSGGLGTVSVSFKEYGIKFDFSPTAMPGGLVAARIATEVSSVDFEVQVKDVPGIIKRRAETALGRSASFVQGFPAVYHSGFAHARPWPGG